MAELVRFPIEGMTCTSCVGHITKAVRRIDGVYTESLGEEPDRRVVIHADEERST